MRPRTTCRQSDHIGGGGGWWRWWDLLVLLLVLVLVLPPRGSASGPAVLRAWHLADVVTWPPAGYRQVPPLAPTVHAPRRQVAQGLPTHRPARDGQDSARSSGRRRGRRALLLHGGLRIRRGRNFDESNLAVYQIREGVLLILVICCLQCLAGLRWRRRQARA